MMKKIFLPLLLLIPAVPPLSAMDVPLELTWTDCVRAAMTGNPALRAKKLAIEQYKYLYQAGFNDYLPSVNLSHSISRGAKGSSPASNSVSTSISADEPIFNLKSLSSIRSAKINYDKAYASYKDESAGLRQALYSAFINLVYAQENVATQEKILIIRKNNAQLVKLDYDSGSESRGNMLYAQAQADLSQSDVLQAERSLNSARLNLLNSMGISEFRPIIASATLTVPDYTFDTGNVKNIIDNIPQVVLQEKSLESQKEQMLSAKYDLYPTLGASQSLSWSGNREFSGAQGWSAGLSLSLPLFSNGITYYANNSKAAEWAFKSSEASLKDTKNSLENNILNGYNDFLNAKDTALVRLSVLNADEERYKESQIKYQAGQMSFIDLETTEQSMVSSRLSQLTYFKNALTTKISLENLLGVGLEDQ